MLLTYIEFLVDEIVRMMNDMTNIANALGAYLPGSEPQFMVRLPVYIKIHFDQY